MIDEARKLFITAFKRAALVSASIGGGIAAAHLLARSDQHDVLSVFVFLLMIGAFIGLFFRRRRGISALALLFTLGVTGSPVTSLRDDYLKEHDPAEYTRVVAARAARAVQAEKEDAEQARQAAVVAEAKREAAAEKKIEQARLSDLIGRSVVTEHRRGGARGHKASK